MRKFLKEYFSFSRTEIRMILIISILIAASLILRMLIPDSDYPGFELNSEDSAAVHLFINSFQKEEKLPFSENQYPAKKTAFEFRDFDPNTVSLNELDEMGLPSHLGKKIIHYREAGGRFRQKSDLRKIYGFADSIYQACEKYICIAEDAGKDSIPVFHFLIKKVELNAADSSDLLDVNGIGPYFAGKIIDYREKLGGFANIRQLLEIQGMDSARLELLKDILTIDSLGIKKLNLNNCEAKELAKHPYLSKRQAESIIKYRQFAGKIKSIDELKTNRILTKESIEKLEPYILLNN